jgi:hypothetical protein
MFSKKVFSVMFLVILSAIIDTVNALPGNIRISKHNICYKYASWTAEEDAKLLEMYEIHKNNPRKWEEISHILKRDLRCTREHYELKLNPSLKNPQAEWTNEENDLILEEIKVKKTLNSRPRWKEIARQINRSPKSVYRQSEKIRNGKVVLGTIPNAPNITKKRKDKDLKFGKIKRI